MPSWKSFSLIALLALAGCGGGGDAYMPMSKGAEWSYGFRGVFQTGVYRVSALEPTSVAESAGWTLSGPMGRSRLAWRGTKLMAAELAGTQFHPPISLLDASAPKGSRRWEGAVVVNGKSTPAQARIDQTESSTTLNGRKFSGIQVRIALDLDGRTYESTTIYSRGVGIVVHEQRDNGRFVLSQEYLSGP